MKNRPLLALLSVLALFGGAALVAGCGSDSPEDVVQETFEAIQDGDAEKACDNVSQEALDQFDEAGTNCEDAFAESTTDDVDDFEITGSEEDGDDATVTVESDGEEEDVPLVKEDGDWKIAIG